MIIWQLLWDPTGQFFLWGEGAVRTESADTSGPGITGRAHPCACPTAELAQQLSTIELEADEATSIVVRVPSQNGQPLSPPQLKSAQGTITLESWEVPALKFAPLPGLGFLTSLPHQAPDGVRYGDSLRFWVEASKFMLELLSRGRFLPGINRNTGGFSAHWYLAPENDRNNQRLAVLVNSMPELCVQGLAEQKTEELNAEQLLDSFLGKGADALIRMFLRAYVLTPPAGGISARHAARVEWLSGLTRNNPEVQGTSFDFSALEHKLRRWGSKLQPKVKREPLQVAFRLCPPEMLPEQEVDFENLTWKVDFLLRSHTHPEHSISGADLWNAQLGFLSQSDYTIDELEERLLRDLGRALHVFPKLSGALRERFPEAVSLSTDEAYSFLRETSALLEKADFGVILPEWWQERTHSLGLHLHVESEQRETDTRSHFTGLGLDQLLNYSWQIALGDRVLEADEFRNLVQRQLPLIAVNGRWIELQPERVKAALDFLDKARKQKYLRALDALRLGLGVEDPDMVLPVTSFSAAGWIEQLIQGGKKLVSEIEQPSGFKGELRPYQLDGLRWLAFLSGVNIGGCLADDMGLGKTIQFLALLLIEREMQPENAPKPLPTLLIVPMSILHNWHQEALKFSPQLNVYVHHGPQRLVGQAFIKAADNADLIVTTYNLAFRDEALFNSVEWGRITLDEAQNIKNPKTKQSRAIRRLSVAQLRERPDHGPVERLVLTGTPLENHLEELWSIFEFLNPAYLGSLKDFRSRFALPIERYRDATAAGNLAKLVSPFILRRLKRDPAVLTDLPEKIEIDVSTSLTAEQAALYQSVIDNMLPQVDQASGMHRKGLVLATITKLKQICNHPALFLKDQQGPAERSGKLLMLDEFLDVIIDEGDKVLIFTQFAQMGHLLRAHLEQRYDRGVLFLHGGLNQADRIKAVSAFQKTDGPPIFILSLKAGGLGLNLTEANQVVHYDQWWNPAVQEQATDRAYRIGQKRNVQVRKLICRGTLEERIHALLGEKRELADRIVSSTKNTLTQLSTDELRDLLKLSAPRDYMDEN